jgi:putative flippase GtrA
MLNSILIFKLIKFCCVGFSGMILDFGTTSVLKEKVKVNKYISNSMGFVLAATSNYFLNRMWTFQSQNTQIVTEYMSFITIAVIGLLINNAIIFGLNDKMKINFYLSKLMAILMVTFWNFGLNYLITFAR